jgi:predicted nucleotidyltransferase
MQSVLDTVTKSAGLDLEDFGVFGSLLHGFYNPRLSDIDLVVYGEKKVAGLRETLKELYEADSSPLKNEFETEQSIKGKDWRFRNFSLKEYLWHQRRKLIYALFDNSRSRRKIKTEFEPVKDWNEISSEYSPETRILQRGWTRILAKVTHARQAPFIPSVYGIDPQQVLEGPREAIEAKRIVSYMEEFRMQAGDGETVYVDGNLEEVTSPKRSFYQIALTYCERYYEQVLKVKN